MRPPLDPAFLNVPLAHRGLHDRTRGVIENSRAAIAAAADAGYGIEIDLQLSADGEAMVFHDDDLDRLTAERGAVRERTARELGFIELAGGRGDTIPTLAEIMSLVAGRVPLLVEIKDQHGALGPVDGRLERRVARLAGAYPGPIALMSFNPHAVEVLKAEAPGIARGRVTCAFDEADWPRVPAARREALARLDDLDALEVSFISHQQNQLLGAKAAKEAGLPVICWTVRTPEAETAARAVADNITFEGYPA